MKHNLLIAMIFSTLLTGCTSMNSTFDCPMKPGVMCKSLDQVNRMVDEGKLGQESCCDASSGCVQHISFEPAYSHEGLSHDDTAVRHHETVMRVWVAPFEDKQGNYHEDNIIYTVAKPGYWSGRPVKALKDGV